jgi:ABC-type amino acid transport system permease subunit
MTAVSEETRRPRVSVFNDPKVRSIFAQVVFVALVVWAGYEIVSNTAANLHRLGKGIDFKFLGTTSGFDIIQSLIPYSSASSYARADRNRPGDNHRLHHRYHAAFDELDHPQDRDGLHRARP